MNFYDNFSVFGAVEISLNGQNDTLKTFTSEFMITKSELHNYFTCEFTAYCAHRNAEMKTTTTTVLISHFVKDRNTRQQLSFSFPELFDTVL